MSTINPLLVILLVPVFELFIYPVCIQLGVLATPLQKMGCGGVLAALSFVIVGFIQLAVDKTAVALPADHHTRVVLINLSNDSISGSASDLNFTVLSGGQTVFDTRTPPEIFGQPIANITRGLRKEAHLVVVYEQNDHQLEASVLPFKLEKIPDGFSQVLIMSNSVKNLSLTVANDKETYKAEMISNNLFKPVLIQPSLLSDPDYLVTVRVENSPTPIVLGSVTPGMGGVYGLIVSGKETLQLTQLALVEANSVSILWQILPYVVITIGEIMFSITGLEFSYSQAPTSMKSILQAIWLLTVAFGNLIDIIISGSHFIESKPTEFFVYAALMALTITVFGVMAYFYQYADSIESDIMPSDPKLTKEELMLLDQHKLDGSKTEANYGAL